MNPSEAKPLDLGGTWRTRTARDTLQLLLEPDLLEAIGVSRIAHVDGLDRLDLPTVIAHRPRGSSLSSHQGKGLDHELATISAVMEALDNAPPSPMETDQRSDMHTCSQGGYCCGIGSGLQDDDAPIAAAAL